MNINITVANVYHPIKRSPYGGLKKEKGIPAIANPKMYPQPQNLFFIPITIPGMLVVNITDKNANITKIDSKLPCR